MLYSTQMVGASPNRYLQAAYRTRSRQATTRSLWTLSINGAFFLPSFLSSLWLGFGLRERGGAVEVVVIVIIMMMTMIRDVY